MSHFLLPESVLNKFAREELELEIRLEILQAKRRLNKPRETKSSVLEFQGQRSSATIASRSEALRRNKMLLKDLDVQAAKLRSRTCYCPTDLHLTSLRKKYHDELAAHYYTSKVIQM
ncbi:unnamed protein product [Timema podura]|uniref:Uncharacterized protein n=1 Tax=Timema podura TaxID=61482 RepID=A0ABN7NIS3_TIMPD|nr:unnamed protein product [Timema podura]